MVGQFGGMEVIGRRRLQFGATALIVAAAQFPIAEGIAALAWVHPRYSYSQNYISDLGVTHCGEIPTPSLNAAFSQAGQTLCSPLNGVLNTGFVLLGLVFMIGVLLLVPVLPRPTRVIQTVFAVLFGVALTTAGFIHGQASEGHAIIFHVLGAFVALVVGALSVILTGITSVRLGAPRWFQVLSIALGVFSLACSGLIAIPNAIPVPTPLFERGATYPFIAWNIILGIMLLSGLAHRATSHATPR